MVCWTWGEKTHMGRDMGYKNYYQVFYSLLACTAQLYTLGADTEGKGIIDHPYDDTDPHHRLTSAHLTTSCSLPLPEHNVDEQAEQSKAYPSKGEYVHDDHQRQGVVPNGHLSSTIRWNTI